MADEKRTEDERQEGNPPEAKADQSRFNVNIVSNLVPKSRGGWIVFILLLIFLLSAWYFNFLNFRYRLLGFGIAISALIIILIIISFIIYGWATCRDDLAKFYIATALFIWMLDLIPQNTFIIGQWLGPVYQGFEFPFWSVQNVLELPWLPILASSFTFAFLYVNMVYKIIKKDYIAFLLSFGFIILFNYLSNKLPTYLSFSFTIPYGKIILFVLLIFFGWLAWKFDKKRIRTEIPEFFTYLYMVFVFSFFWLNTGWQGNLRAWFHTLYIIGFGFGFINLKERNPAAAHIIIPTLLLIDFFGYGLLYRSDILALQFIPPLVIFVIFYCYEKETEYGTNNYTYPVAAFILLVTFILLMSVSIAGTTSADVPFVARKGPDFKQFFGVMGEKIKEYTETQLEAATGGLYRGFVEKNQFEPLGVFFDNIRAAQPRFYTDEDVTLWATIKSRTLSDPVIVTFSCFRWKDGKRLSAEKNDIIIPSQPFTVYTLEEKDVECTFTQSAKESKIQAGTNTITLSAAYNFATSAYQKAYFIDKGRLRAMVKEGIDPLKEFGIADTTPKTIYTNGPVEIGMNIQNLIPVSDEIEVTPVLGISLINRDKITDKQGKVLGEWQGKIKKINELIVVLPNGITINDPTKDCRPLPFKKIGKSDCPKSCSDTIYSPCIKSCGDSGKCAGECSDAQGKCVDECAELFKGDSENVDYEGYQLDMEQLKNKDEYKDIDRFKTFVCRIVPAKETLENVPITTKFIRTKARYDYLLERSVNLIVEESPIQLSSAETDIFATNFNLQIPLEVYFDQNNKNEIQHSRIVFNAAQKYDVDYLFAKSIIQAESKWNPLAVGDNGNSFGLMQVSKELAASLGCSNDFNSNPISNVDCGVKYIRSLIDIQKNNNLKPGLKNIAAAYDCGQQALYYDKAPYENSAFWENPANCWSKDKNTNTRAYVSRAMNNYNVLLKQLKSKKII